MINLKSHNGYTGTTFYTALLISGQYMNRKYDLNSYIATVTLNQQESVHFEHLSGVCGPSKMEECWSPLLSSREMLAVLYEE